MRRGIRTFILVVISAGVFASSANADWRQFRHGAARAGATAATQITASNAPMLVRGWTRPSGNESNMNSSPAVADNHIFVAGAGLGYGIITSFTNSGQTAWVGYLPFGTDSSPAVVGGRVFVDSCDNVNAFNEKTGARLWQKTFPVQDVIGCSDQASPAVVGGVVYVASDADGKVHALSAATGAAVWSSANLDVRSSTAVAGGYVLVGSNNHRLYAFPQSCTTPCRPAWSRDLGDVVEATPAVVNGLVYTHSWSSPLYALNLTTGATMWTSTASGGGWSSPAVAGGVVYSTAWSPAPGLYAYDAATGHLLWSTGSADGSPAVGNDVVVTTCRYAICIHATSNGALLRRFRPAGQRVFSSAGIGDRALYASRQDELLYRFVLPGSVTTLARR
ncbi:MAG TPA: PQQ-binding-like beta-propeller repeat protein [Gaiellales bacterium]|nr:PQQ-binding-like beta-propeller repeat protein [Gaiellales bacterium]